MPNTGVIDWFQYGGNTYLVEAVNFAASAAAHAALAATDEIIKIVGLVSLEGAKPPRTYANAVGWVSSKNV